MCRNESFLKINGKANAKLMCNTNSESLSPSVLKVEFIKMRKSGRWEANGAKPDFSGHKTAQSG